MKRIILFLISFVLLSSTLLSQNIHQCAAAKQINFQKVMNAKEINYPGDSNIDVNYYKIDVTITYDPKYLEGKLSTVITSLSDNLQEFYFDLADHMQVDSVKNGDAKLSFNHTDEKVVVQLKPSLNSGEKISIEFYYKGNPQSGSGFGSFAFGSHNGLPVIWSLSEPYGASDWFPCKDTPADKVDSSDVWITCDVFYSVVSNGKFMGKDKISSSLFRHKWKNSYPIAQYLISIAMTNYELYSHEYELPGGSLMNIDHYNYPEKLTSSRKSQLDKTVPIMDLFIDLFGNYPFENEKYGHAEFGWPGGMEHQTISSMGSFTSDIIAHELAHQWFGDKVTCADWHHIWLNEGFASYAESLVYENIIGKDEYDVWIAGVMNSAKRAEGSIYVQDISSVSQIFDSRRSYDKAAIVLHMLRGIVGDENFFATLKTYLNDPQLSYNVATTEDFQEIAEQVSGIDLEYFFQEWIYGENYPHYTVDWNTNYVAGNWVINLTVMQSNNSNPDFFKMPIDIKINTSAGDTLITIFNDEQTQEFEFILDAFPLSLSFDPENEILKDINSFTGVNDIYAPGRILLHQNYPNPFNPTTKIKFSIANVGDENIRPLQTVKLIIYDILGREVATLVNKHLTPGNYEVEFNAEGLSSGVYYYRLEAGSYSNTKKMILLR